MIEGFVGGFAIGFLGTALPKMLSVPSLRTSQVGILLILHLTLNTCHLLGHTRAGDGAFALMLSLILAWILMRVPKCESLPPPGMLLAGMGLLCGTLGATWWAINGYTGDHITGLFAHRLLYQAFILLPLLGVGSFIFPMILGTSKPNSRLSGSKASRAWKIKASESGLVGTLLVLSYLIEVQDQTANQGKMMSWLRVLLCFVWLTKESGWLKRKTAKGIMAFSLRAGIVCLLSGMIATGIMQEKRIALEHTLYIGGFGLITMIVASRVIYGHSGQGDKFQRWIKPIAWCTGLLLLGTLTRVTADFMPKIMASHHSYAAACWIIASIIWGIAVLPSVRKHPFPRKLKSSTPESPSLMDMNFRK